MNMESVGPQCVGLCRCLSVVFYCSDEPTFECLSAHCFGVFAVLSSVLCVCIS